MATTGAVTLADPKHYVWWFPGAPVKVHLSFHVVHRLEQQLRGTDSPSLEGILFGRTQHGATEILDFQPLIGGTPANTVAALPADQKQSVVGYYRTEEGAAFQLNAQDRSLAQECFARPDNVLLMIHPTGFGPPVATFFFHDGPGRMSDFAFMEFPFDASLLEVEEQDRLRRSRKTSIETPAVVPSQVVPSQPPAMSIAEVRRSKRGFVLKALLFTSSAAVVFGLGAFFNTGFLRDMYSRLWRGLQNPPAATVTATLVSQPASHPTFALHAVRQNGDLELTWDRESPTIALATSGEILIQDGESSRQVSLDATQLRGGSLLYTPTSDQVLMRLTVTTPAESVSESITAILSGVKRPQNTPPPATKPSANPNPSTSQPVGQAALVKPSKSFTAPTSAKDSSQTVPLSLQDAPALRIDSGTTPNPVAPALGTPPPPARPPQTPPSTIATYEPPIPVVKRTPAIPPELHNLIARPTTVQVNVTIDKDGKVSRAEAVPLKNVSKLLLNSAVNASRLWKFQPARRNHEPVSSEWTLQFVFTP